MLVGAQFFILFHKHGILKYKAAKNVLLNSKHKTVLGSNLH